VKKVAWLGLGLIGLPMASRLAAAGWKVTGYDVNGERLKLASGRGITAATSTAAALEGAELVFTSMPNEKVFVEVLSALRTNAIVIDTSTVGPQASAKVAPSLKTYLRAPISGSVGHAESGQLTTFVSGPRASYDAALDAFNGQDKFTSGKVPLRTLMILYPNRMHVVSIDGTGVEKMADLKGKRVSTGSPGSATEVMAFRLIEAVGLDKDKDMKRERLSVAESVNAVKDRKIDAFFWVGGIPTAAVTDLGATPGTKLKLIDHSDAVAAMNAKYGNLYVKDTIKAGAYPGQDKDNTVATVWNILVTSDKTTDDLAYNIVKLIFDKKPELVAVHKEANSFVLETQKKENSPVPFHPGAIKYFKERGLSF